TITLDGGSVTDSGTPNVWPTGNWDGSVDVTGYNWVHITSTNPDVASASYRTDGGRLSITFTPGTESGTTKISVGVDAKYPHYSLGTWNMNLNFDYTVTNKTGSTVTPEPDGEKPAPSVTYTVLYTDGVVDEIVFADQETKGLSAGAATPAFKEEAGKTETVVEDERNVVRPIRAGYTFEGWSPAINSEVDADDADTNGVITYTATWQKKSGIDDTKITVTKTPSEEYPEVGEEFKYTIEMENDNDQPV
ncbi:hypothetical protein D7X48_22845, partial [bacterium D16-50]